LVLYGICSITELIKQAYWNIDKTLTIKIYLMPGEFSIMKKNICIFFMTFFISNACIAQEQKNMWNGTVRFNPADLFVNLHNAIPGAYVTWTPYILPNLGIPAEIDVNFGWGVLPGLEISLLSGIEYLPIRSAGKDKNGPFLDAKAGLSLFFNKGGKAAFIAKTNAGYQFVTGKGFTILPGVGLVYNGRNGFGLNIMLDFGFAYK
jgi:hypothetical protein